MLSVVDELELFALLSVPLALLDESVVELFTEPVAEVRLALRSVVLDVLFIDDPAFVGLALLPLLLDMLPLLFVDESLVAPVLLLVPALPLVCAMAAPPAMPTAATATADSLRMAFIQDSLGLVTSTKEWMDDVGNGGSPTARRHGVTPGSLHGAGIRVAARSRQAHAPGFLGDLRRHHQLHFGISIMTILDKVIAAVTPPETQKERDDARAKARAAAANAPWLARVLEHHLQIESAFAAVKDAADANGRRRAQKWLGTLLTGHSLAEEAVLYPAMALGDQKAHATSAYTEQSGAKINLAALESMDPMSQDYLDKLEHVRGAVAHHVYEEEGTWFPELAKEGGSTLQMRLASRYSEEFERYMGADADGL